jgi:hypothetical protein
MNFIAVVSSRTCRLLPTRRTADAGIHTRAANVPSAGLAGQVADDHSTGVVKKPWRLSHLLGAAGLGWPPYLVLTDRPAGPPWWVLLLLTLGAIALHSMRINKIVDPGLTGLWAAGSGKKGSWQV